MVTPVEAHSSAFIALVVLALRHAIVLIRGAVATATARRAVGEQPRVFRIDPDWDQSVLLTA